MTSSPTKTTLTVGTDLNNVTNSSNSSTTSSVLEQLSTMPVTLSPKPTSTVSTFMSTTSAPQTSAMNASTTPTTITTTDASTTPRTTTTTDANIRTTNSTLSSTKATTTILPISNVTLTSSDSSLSSSATSPTSSTVSTTKSSVNASVAATTHSIDNGITVGITNSTLSTTLSLALPLTTSASTNETEVSKLTSGDCSKVVVLSVAVSAAIWLVTVVILLIIMFRLRKRWKRLLDEERLRTDIWSLSTYMYHNTISTMKRRLDEERQRTDIWSLSTYHNTIINDGFLDYRLAPKTRGGKRLSDTSSNPHTARLKQGRLSGAALSRTSSIYNDDYSFRQSIIRRSTLSDDERFRYSRSKTRARRQPSAQSSDYWQEQSSDFRPRTSTFTIGKKRDKHALVNHDQLRIVGSHSFDGYDMLEKQSAETSFGKEQPSYYHVTEL